MPQQNYRRSGKVQVSCRRCGQTDHTAARCNTPDSECRCVFCGELGHSKFFCPIILAKNKARREDMRMSRLFERHKNRPEALMALREDENYADFKKWMDENVEEMEIAEMEEQIEEKKEEDVEITVFGCAEMVPLSKNEQIFEYECEHCGITGSDEKEIELHELTCPKKKKKKKKKKVTKETKEKTETKTPSVISIGCVSKMGQKKNSVNSDSVWNVPKVVEIFDIRAALETSKKHNG